MRMHSLHAPVIANVFVLSAGVARYFHAGHIPGVEVTDRLLELCERQAQSADKGKAFFIELAAQQCAIARGLGYRGVYLGGHLRYDDYEKIIALSQSYAQDDWRDFARSIDFAHPDEFYFFAPDDATGLSSDRINPDYLASKEESALRALRRDVPSGYKLNRIAHDHLFEAGSLGHKLGQKITETVDRHPTAQKALHTVEQATKIPLFDCRDCGDCSLPDIAYLCPESECAKNQRNGPCGGTRQGLCEVGEKECIWSRAYDRLKAYGEEERMLERPVVIKDGALHVPAPGSIPLPDAITMDAIRRRSREHSYNRSTLYCRRRKHPHHARALTQGEAHSEKRRGLGEHPLSRRRQQSAPTRNPRSYAKDAGL